MFELVRNKVLDNKIVVRIEISTLLDSCGSVDAHKMDRLAMLLSNLHNSGKQVVVVSSGAIALGTKKMGLPSIPDTMLQQQAIAAIGQAELIKAYQKYFGEYNQIVAQVLLTHDVVEKEKRRNNATNTFNRLLEMNIIPVVNENDAISTNDLVLDDNYPLALNVAELINAQIILIKTNDDGHFIIVRRGLDKQFAVKEENIFERIEELIGEKEQHNSDFTFPLNINDLQLN